MAKLTPILFEKLEIASLYGNGRFPSISTPKYSRYSTTILVSTGR